MQDLHSIVAAEAEGRLYALRLLTGMELAQVVPRAQLVAPPALVYIVAICRHLLQLRFALAAGKNTCASSSASAHLFFSELWT